MSWCGLVNELFEASDNHLTCMVRAAQSRLPIPIVIVYSIVAMVYGLELGLERGQSVGLRT